MTERYSIHIPGNGSQHVIIRFLPLVISEAQIDRVVEALGEVLEGMG